MGRGLKKRTDRQNDRQNNVDFNIDYISKKDVLALYSTKFVKKTIYYNCAK